MRSSKFNLFVLMIFVSAFIFIFGCGTASKPPVPTSFDAYQNAPYKKLCSESFIDEYAGKYIHFKAMFVGEWTLTNLYTRSGIDIANKVFINHRDVSYKSQETGLGSSDAMTPEFALSISKDKSDIVYNSSRGDIIEVWGYAEKAGGFGKRQLNITATKIVKR